MVLGSGVYDKAALLIDLLTAETSSSPCLRRNRLLWLLVFSRLNRMSRTAGDKLVQQVTGLNARRVGAETRLWVGAGCSLEFGPGTARKPFPLLFCEG